MITCKSLEPKKFGDIKRNMFPPITPKQNLIEENNSYLKEIFKNESKENNIKKNPLFSQTMFSPKENLTNSAINKENIDSLKNKILLELNGLEKRKIDIINDVTQLELKKDNLNKQINEMSLKLEKMQSIKIDLMKEEMDIRKDLEELKEEKNNLGEDIAQMKNNYKLYLNDIQSIDNRFEKKHEEINKREEELNLKEKNIDKKNIKRENELKKKEDLVENLFAQNKKIKLKLKKRRISKRS